MADLSLSQLKTRLRKMVRDVAATTWTDDEVTEAMTQALDNDQYVLQKTRDTSLETTARQVTYPLPDGFMSVDSISIDWYEDGFGLKLDRTSWEIDDTNIYFNRRIMNLPDGKPLILWGMKKLSSTDLIPDRYQNYILHLASISLLEDLTFSKTGKFLKNDTTMGEIMQALQYHNARVQDLRKQFLNRNETPL